MWDTSRKLFAITNLQHLLSTITNNINGNNFWRKNWPVQDQLQINIVLDCWGELTRTPRADGRHQESDQELIFLMGDCHSFLNDSFSPGLSTLFKILLVGVCGLTRQVTLPD